jgi:hypothetical protein
MNSSNNRLLTVSPRDDSMAFDEATRIIKNVPGVRLTNVDPKNRIAIVEVPGHLQQAVKKALEHRFLVDENAPLRY